MSYRIMQDKLYIPVEEVNFNDLYDWSDPKQRCKTSNGVVKPGLIRQNSRTGTLVRTNEKKIALFRFKNQVYAIDEACPHAGGPLHLGDIEELSDSTLCVRCPWHSWKIDLQNGHILLPNRKDVSTNIYPVIVAEDGKISVGFDKFDPKFFTGDTEF